ncbi:GTP cyclohydrolase FolE2 [Spirochaetia bacterium]|nr:GTP cyclohydrolase FolE2 [Spirochaetia bacterium]GHU33816.1 GTP cyclohydrolase FolE2 [Spirochaetia bacterium]
MIDVQNQTDEREVPLTKVGVKGLEYPIRVLDKLNKVQWTTAQICLSADLPRHFKGTHMSRFVEIFHQYRNDISMPHFLEMLQEIRNRLDAEAAFGTVHFPYFLEKTAPVSGFPGMMSYQCRYQGMVNSSGRHFKVAVSVPVTTVCPCSKVISDRGAHNQRGIVTVEVELGPFFWIEDLIAVVESCASSPVYSLLKREDEKYITEYAYDNPKFVEDLVRDVYIKVKELKKFPWFSVEAENLESIHNHSAFAYTEYKNE